MNAKRLGKEGPESGVQSIKGLLGTACRHEALVCVSGKDLEVYGVLQEVRIEKGDRKHGPKVLAACETFTCSNMQCGF